MLNADLDTGWHGRVMLPALRSYFPSTVHDATTACFTLVGSHCPTPVRWIREPASMRVEPAVLKRGSKLPRKPTRWQWRYTHPLQQQGTT